ncbi:uncharacterized protein M437DRAFT_83417 [Aureobasidium melanogenum CBS 110374]|uniref:Uncharacterized protein n=1 Tax=Aureobasidium melanogenum (strain CBS 110374) TaxID=1043003 RepID=A0A074WMP1_AURM1|nr:uncharacterized protein M437DRAFT_83417 [Aureobasidium melanogenum CBS 110374]KEQ63686.1 hypothetical protein M437DRAFT_83417 [Aureobasidium melanogenum CBS 110374]
MGWPYDIETMNNYKLTGESDPVEVFQVVVEITGDDQAIWAATVSKYRNNALQEFRSTNADNLGVDQSLTVTGLPRDLVITRRSASDGDRIDFVYGDPARELAGFAFNSDDTGFSPQFDKEADEVSSMEQHLDRSEEEGTGLPGPGLSYCLFLLALRKTELGHGRKRIRD